MPRGTGRTSHIRDVAEALGLTPKPADVLAGELGITRNHVYAAVSYLRSHYGLDIIMTNTGTGPHYSVSARTLRRIAELFVVYHTLPT